ncbi:hypothetical protein IFR05_011440 [Cadophora sp. M221]|nr:hypothetical protein IFR05_011440 [Cadophora sp. M221]
MAYNIAQLQAMYEQQMNLNSNTPGRIQRPGFGTQHGNAQYISTNNMYTGVPSGSGILAFNNLPQMQHHLARPNMPFALQYESARSGSNHFMTHAGGLHNGQIFIAASARHSRPPCDLCSSDFASWDNLLRHRREIHGC